jgi:hypothetical protein
MLKYFFIIAIHVSFCSFAFAAGKTEKEESCSWACKLPYYVCLERGFEMSDKEKIRQSCYNPGQEEDPRDCVFDNYKKLSKEKRYETLKNRCKSEKLKCVNDCMSR